MPGPALAHVASAEAIVCVEKIAGLDPEPVNYGIIPGCTYTTPEVASCGLTEEAARAAGKEVKTGKFMFMASGKASAAGARDGFVKLVFDASDNKLLGAQMTGMNVTEMIASVVVAMRMGATAHDIITEHTSASYYVRGCYGGCRCRYGRGNSWLKGRPIYQ